METHRFSNTYILPTLIIVYATIAACLSSETFFMQLLSYGYQLWNVTPTLIVVSLALAVIKSKRIVDLLPVFRNLISRLATASLLMCIGLASFTTLKLVIPEIVPFYLDPVLADLDSFLHGGDPGLALHGIIPSDAALPILILYGPVWALIWFGGFFAVTLLAGPDLRWRYWWTFSLAFLVLGTVAATLMSSVGPIYYERMYGDARFSELMQRIHLSDAEPGIRKLSDYLWTAYTTEKIRLGSGISAMPSMHVAVATLQALMAWQVSRALGFLLTVFAVVISIGSMYLGWHYAIDGYLSAAVVCGLWYAVGAATQHLPGRQTRQNDLAVA